ncbi:FtsW/RodA/SpoVE family cell cycle protein [Fredinandcohnia sp. QZ13]|uniref:FtsW/RodA/SpoVE family cell cycle protein n=1 Tax=Fredinandcohnia sp. QZ13 TaxID=3073144 RepID=UPI0028530E8A|nr:FtsW/RodA/SpoVE family cell cycle protein [Fredinandcohnia sp. QZ13]MDR4886996.1 FtsW/RodA/SpoVE family cell cycle protein [Fredinandcohnia sp. QZ13]
MNKENTPQKIDYTLLFILFLMAIVSAIAIQSSQPFLPEKLKNINFAAQQLQWYVIGIFAIIGTMVIDFDRFKMISWYLYGFGMVLLFGLFLEKFISVPFAQTIKGATAWYSFPGLGSFQPSELMKIIMIIVLSKIIADHRENYPINTVRDDLLLIGKFIVTSLPPIFLLYKQPDMGMIMVFMSIIATMILVAGIKWRIILTVVFTAVFAISLGVFLYFNFPDFFFEYIIEDYQMNRFYGWLAPFATASNEGHQLVRSLLAIGSGQLHGKGFQESEVTIPEGHTDFIFAVIAEQFGFIGTSIIISLFFLLIYRMIHIALESHDPYGSYLCAGVIGMITFQVFQNVGMTVGILPITGLPLPFISYGGSSLATYMIAIGIVLNVRSRTKKFMFD